MTPPREDEVVLRIRRQLDPSSPCTVQEVRIPRRHGWSVLDALQHVKDRIDPTLSFRGSCRMGICGSCGLEVDGTPVLACSTFVRDASGPMSIEPLGNFPVERDLVVSRDDPMDSLVRLHTWLEPAHPAAPQDPPRLQTPAQLAAYKDHAMCINCMLCYSACPQYGLDDFLGPAALALAQRYDLDSRDAGTARRVQRAGAEDGVWRCTVVGTCSEVCPAGVRPATAIQQLKLAATLAAVKPRPAREPEAERRSALPSPGSKPPVSRLWWTRRPAYRWYMLREASALLTAAYAVFVLVVAARLSDVGAPMETRVDRAIALLGSPWVLLLHAVALPFLVLHALSWFRIAPMLLRTRRPGPWVLGFSSLPFLLALAILAGVLR